MAAADVADGLARIAGGFLAIGKSLRVLAAETKAASDSIVGDIAAIKDASASLNLSAVRSMWNPAGTPSQTGATGVSASDPISQLVDAASAKTATGGL